MVCLKKLLVTIINLSSRNCERESIEKIVLDWLVMQLTDDRQEYMRCGFFMLFDGVCGNKMFEL